MGMLHKLSGDLFAGVDDSLVVGPRDIIIPHVCNNIGAWGAGFVLPLAKKYPVAKEVYHEWHTNINWCGSGEFALGHTQLVAVDTRVTVANMIAQDGITSRSTGGREHVCDRPLRYNALVHCMEEVGEFASETNTVIHCPKFGSDLAGGNWEFIEELIKDCWLTKCDVVVYSLTGWDE